MSELENSISENSFIRFNNNNPAIRFNFIANKLRRGNSKFIPNMTQMQSSTKQKSHKLNAIGRNRFPKLFDGLTRTLAFIQPIRFSQAVAYRLLLKCVTLIQLNRVCGCPRGLPSMLTYSDRVQKVSE